MDKVKGKKVFITYKYGDTNVRPLPNFAINRVRNYTDVLQDMFEESPHIYKAEEDGNDLSRFKDETIESKLKEKIFDSTITIVLISPNMRNVWQSEDDQWIPWEISYSLKEHSRNERTSGSNAILGVVLPDFNGSYEYFLSYDANCNSTNYNTPSLFRIIRENMFNKKIPQTNNCNGKTIYSGYFSYVYCVKWDDFVNEIDRYLNIAIEINDNIDNYNITKTV